MSTLVGHHGAVAAFREAMAGGRMHHAWLLTGPKGVGKGRFAGMAALRLLADAAGPRVDSPGLATPADHPIARLIAAQSHPDFRRLERLWREKTKDFARNITVDQVRGLQPVLAATPFMSDWRAIVIDAIDDLEPSAANALLKNLEEPPVRTVFLLVCHAPGKLLPTIRSRCTILRFGTLAEAEMRAVLADALPVAAPAEIDALVAAGGGAPGRAIGYAGLDIAGIDAALARIARTGDPANAERGALARALAGKAAQARYEAFLERAQAHAAAAARDAQGQALAAAVSVWEKARALAESAVRLSLDPQTTVFELAGLLATLASENARADG